MPVGKDINAFLDELDRQGVLPTPPAVAMEVLRISQNPSTSIRDVAAVVGKDPALTGKLLKTVNSALFGLPMKVSSIEQAAVILGLRSIRILALSFCLVSDQSRKVHEKFDYQYYWANAFTCAVSARMLMQLITPHLCEDAYACGLLQNIGVLVFQQCAAEDYEKVMESKKDPNRPLTELEEEVFGFSHADVSSRLLSRWGLPELIVRAVRNHHRPEAMDSGEAIGKLVGALYTASLAGQLFCDPHKSVTLARIYEGGTEYLGLSRDRIDGVLQKVQDRVRENLRLFDLDVAEPESFENIQQQTRLELARLGMEAQSELQQATSRQAGLLGDNIRLQDRTLKDPLTALANRAALDERLSQHFANPKSALPVSVLMIDIDTFKQHNDKFGHAVGDQLLIAVAKLIQVHIRQHDLAARYGGDELVVILPQTTLDQAVRIAERIRTSIQKGRLVPGHPDRLTVSIGAACTSDLLAGSAMMGPGELLNEADRQMYAAKDSGRNCTVPALSLDCPVPSES